MFVQILKDSLDLLKKNINLVFLVLLFFITTSMFTPVLTTFKLNIKIIPAMLIFLIFLCALFAGLFFAFKKAMEYRTKPPKQKNDFEMSPMYFSEFFQGTGSCFTKFLSGGIVLFVIFGIFLAFYNYSIHHFSLIPDFILKKDVQYLLTDDAALRTYINSLTDAQQSKILLFAGYTFVIFSLFGILTMLYPVSLINEKDNFLKSFLISLKLLFKNPIVSLAIFFFFNIALALAGMLSAINNLFIAVIALLLQCYLNTWYILSLFVYYEKVK